MTLTRDTQEPGVIYVIEGTGTAFVTPDGEGRYWYSRNYYAEQEIPEPAEVTAMLAEEDDDDEAARIVAGWEYLEVTGVRYIDPDDLEED